ncbi:protein phosphatase 1 regulatory subunit 14C-like [Glandiceps talaboti]
MAMQVGFNEPVPNSENDSTLKVKSNRQKNHLTQKYDPKSTRRRLQVEEWMDEELKELYECDEDEDYDIEIDIDELLSKPEASRYTAVQNLLEEAKKPIDDFIKELLEKIKKL